MVRLFEAGTNVIDVPQKMMFRDKKGKTHILPTLTGKKHIISSHYGLKAIAPIYHISSGKNILKVHKGVLVKLPKEPKEESKASKKPRAPKKIKAPKTIKAPRVKRAYKRKTKLNVSTIPFATPQEILENNAIMKEQRVSNFLNSRPSTKRVLALTNGPLALTNGPLALTNGSSMSSALVVSQSIPTGRRILALTNGNPEKRRRGRPAGSKNKKKA
jgi:hypothetical protein